MNISNQITVVIVLYNSSNLIFDCLNSLNKFSIILVDNGKNLHLLEKLKEIKNIKIISKNKNLGYGKAVNFAFELIKSPYFLTLNPDITIDENFIEFSFIDYIKNYINFFKIYYFYLRHKIYVHYFHYIEIKLIDKII